MRLRFFIKLSLMIIVNHILLNLNLIDDNITFFIFNCFLTLIFWKIIVLFSFREDFKNQRKLYICLKCLIFLLIVFPKFFPHKLSKFYFDNASLTYCKAYKEINYLSHLIEAIGKKLPILNFPPLVSASKQLYFKNKKKKENERILSFLNPASNLFQFEIYQNSLYPPKNAYILDLKNGNYFASWLTNSNQLLGQLLAKDGSKIGSYLTISAIGTSGDVKQDLALLNNGNIFVLIKKGDFLNFKIYDPSGNLITFKENVITTVAGTMGKSYVIPLMTNRFVIIWIDNSRGLAAQIFNNDGTSFTSTFSILSNFFNNDYGSFGATVIGSSKFIVTYSTGINSISQNFQLFAQIFLNDGTKSGEEFKITNNCNCKQQYPSISTLGNGKIIITWIEGITRYGRILEGNGSKFGSNFIIDSLTSYSPAFSNLYVPLGITTLENDYFAIFNNVNVQIFSYLGEPIFLDISIRKQDYDNNIYTTHENVAIVLTTEKKLLTSYVEGYSVKVALIAMKPSIFYNPFQRQGSEFIINTYVSSDQIYPRSCILSNDNILIVWQSNNQDSDSYGIFARILNEKGEKIGEEFQVNTYIKSSQSKPALAADHQKGGFIIIWLSAGQNNGATGCYGQYFLNDGTSQGPEFRINKETQEIFSSEIIQTSNGNWVASFSSSYLNGIKSTNIRIFNNNRLPITDDIPIYESSSDKAQTSIFPISNGKFKLLYCTWNNDFRVQTFEENGIKTGESYTLVTGACIYNFPKVAKFSNDNFVIIWTLLPTSQIFVQRFFANNSEFGNKISVYNSMIINSIQHFVMTLDDGKFIVGWKSLLLKATSSSNEKNTEDIYAQLFSTSGGIIGNQFKLSSVSPQNNVWLLPISNDVIFFVWENSEMDSSSVGISGLLVKILSPIQVYPNEIIAMQTVQLLKPFTFNIPSTIFIEAYSSPLAYEYQLKNAGDMISWFNLEGSKGTFSGTPPFDSAKNYTIELFASNSAGAFASTTFVLQVINLPPILIGSIPNVSCEVFQTFKFTIKKSEIFQDPENQFISLSFLDIPNWFSYNNITSTFAGTPAESNQGIYIITVIASDDYGGSTSTSFTITVKNRPPTTVGTIPNMAIIGGHSFSIQISIKEVFYDPDNDKLKGNALLSNGSNLPTWIFFSSDEFKFSGRPPSNDLAIYSINLTANDGNGGYAVASSFNLSTSPNNAPILLHNIANKTDLIINVPFVHIFSNSTFFDADNDTLTYSALLHDRNSLPSWLLFSSDSRTFYGTPNSGSNKVYFIVVTADDGAGGNSACQFILSRPNFPPRAGMFSESVIDGVGQSFSFSFPDTMFVDDDGDLLIISASLSNGLSLPLWLGFDPNFKKFFGTPKSGLQGSYNITVTADDSAGGIARVNFTLILKNSVPIAQQLPTSQIYIKKYFNYQFSNTTFQDPDGDPLVYSASWNETSIPGWLRFFSENRTLAGTPISGSQGILLIKITAADGFGGKAASNVYFTIPNSIPFVKSKIAEQKCSFVNENYVFQIPAGSFIDPDDDKLYYEVALEDNLNLPYWLSFNSSTMIFTGKPTRGSQGTYLIKVLANDGYGGYTYSNFKLIVPNRKPQVNSALSNQKTDFIGQQFRFSLDPQSFIDLDDDPLFFMIFFEESIVLPHWLSFNSSSLTFSGIPPIGSQGDHLIKVLVKDDSGDSESQTFTLTIPNRDIKVNYISPKTAYIGISFYLSVSNMFTDYDGGPLTYSALMENGTVLPTWLEFGNGVFAGIPLDPDELNIRVIVSKINGNSVSSIFKLLIKKFETSTTIPQVSETQTISNLNITIMNEFNFTFSDDIFINPSGKPLIYKVSQISQYSLEEDLPSWLNFSGNTFTGTPSKGSHVDKLIIKLTAINFFQETASLIFKIFFKNRPPKLNKEIIVMPAIINSILIISLPFEDEDGDALTLTIQKKISFLELNSETQRLTVLPKSGNEGSFIVNVTATDGFGGICSAEFRINVEFSDYDKWMQIISFFIPIMSSLGTIFAIYTKRGLLWNLSFFLVRPRIVKWNVKNEKLKILVKDMPGWIHREEFCKKVPIESPKPINGFFNKIFQKMIMICRVITCRLNKKKGPLDEKIRMTRLKLSIKIVQTVFIPNSTITLIKNINSFEFMDCLLRANYDLVSAKIDKSDFSLRIKKSSRQYLLSLLSNGDQIKFLIIDHDKRILEKIICELDYTEDQSQLPVNSGEREEKIGFKNETFGGNHNMMFSFDIKEKSDEEKEKNRNSLIMEENFENNRINTKEISTFSRSNGNKRKKLKEKIEEIKKI